MLLIFTPLLGIMESALILSLVCFGHVCKFYQVGPGRFWQDWEKVRHKWTTHRTMRPPSLHTPLISTLPQREYRVSNNSVRYYLYCDFCHSAVYLQADICLMCTCKIKWCVCGCVYMYVCVCTCVCVRTLFFPRIILSFYVAILDVVLYMTVF